MLGPSNRPFPNKPLPLGLQNFINARTLNQILKLIFYCCFLQDSSVLHVEILDINDNAPEFVPSPSASLSTYIRLTDEGPESANSIIIDVNATDKDKGTNAKILYSMSGDEHGYFQLNSTTVSWLSSCSV